MHGSWVRTSSSCTAISEHIWMPKLSHKIWDKSKQMAIIRWGCEGRNMWSAVILFMSWYLSDPMFIFHLIRTHSCSHNWNYGSVVKTISFLLVAVKFVITALPWQLVILLSLSSCFLNKVENMFLWSISESLIFCFSFCEAKNSCKTKFLLDREIPATL